MKKKMLFPLILSALTLAGCGDGAVMSVDVENKLSSYDSERILQQVKDNLKSVSSFSESETISIDDTDLYGSFNKTLASKQETKTKASYAFYSDQAYLFASKSETSTEKAGVTVKDSYEVKSTYRALENPDSIKATDSYYGLYCKQERKAGAYDHYGTTYYLSDSSFASQTDLSKNYESSVQSQINMSFSSFTFYESSGGVTGVHSNVYPTTMSNPIYPSDETKKITMVMVSTATVTFKKDSKLGYIFSSFKSEASQSALTNYEGKKIDGVLSQMTSETKYSYGTRSACKTVFTTNDYLNQVNNAPVLAKYTRATTTDDWALSSFAQLTNYSSDYQQANGSGYCFKTSTTANIDTGLVAYGMTTYGNYVKGVLKPDWMANTITFDGVEVTYYNDNKLFAIKGDALVSTYEDINIYVQMNDWNQGVAITID